MRAEVSVDKSRMLSLPMRLAGAAALAAAGFYLWRALDGYGVQLSAVMAQDRRFYLFVAIASLLYAASLGLLGFSWISLLGRNAPRDLSAKLLNVYGVSSCAKYLPGGLLHFGGRQLGGERLGLGHRAIAAASLKEAIFSAAVALAAAALVYAAGTVILVLALAAAIPLAAYFYAKRDRRTGAIVSACAFAFIFMGIMGGLAAACSEMTGGEFPPRLIAAAYLAAWTAGFVIPGLSAGIGVREAVFAFLVSGGAITPELAAIAVFMRLVTTAGDGLFFLFFLCKGTKPLGIKEFSSLKR